jgi:hypothetical protein
LREPDLRQLGGIERQLQARRLLQVAETHTRSKGPEFVLTTSASYGVISANLTRSLKATAAKPQVARETAYYLENIKNVKSIDDFLADDRIFAYAMTAFGLRDMAYAKAFMRKVLTEGIADSDSFANKLADRRYREFADTFNFAQFGTTTTIFDVTRQGTVDRYVRQTLEEDAGVQDEGVRLALYFERKAADLTSPFSILADPALLKVVQTALNLPASMSLLDIDKQAELISARLNVADLKDADARAKFLERFTSLWEIANPQAGRSLPAISIGQPIEAGLGGELLASLQNLKLGG